MGHENGGWMNSDQREAMEDAAKAKAKECPQSNLGKLLLAIVQSVGGTDPRAFVEVDISKAIAEADALSNQSK